MFQLGQVGVGIVLDQYPNDLHVAWFGSAEGLPMM